MHTITSISITTEVYDPESAANFRQRSSAGAVVCIYISQGPPEYGRSCDYSEQVTTIAYYSLL